ncbi:putative sulfate/molybdate transporter [Halomarina pelagica]|uniref:putative sulfate/molybdate transporter n=1 Tax=Halomarina pelagica TaxID=2961599 RepID=UPI0020C5961E|nr:putative sulfate/molybdate transporter [Halomarina sp. BND7]
MAVFDEYGSDRGVELALHEVTGALGDSVTVLPIVVTLCALTPASLPHVLVAFGVFQVVWGVRYGLPMSVEPMKALAGLAIAGALTYGEFLAAGLLAGVLLLAAGATGALGRVERFVGEPVVRGVQLAVALLLIERAFDLALAEPTLALGGVLLAAAVSLVAPRAAALALLGAGVALAVGVDGVPEPTLPALALFPGGVPNLTTAALGGTAAQLAMTVGNAAVATSLLFSDLFDADVPSDDLATNMGAMTLLSVPFGGLPMCHGSGGLAGKYAFGARTGGANVVLGGLYLAAALVAGLWTAFPLALLGAVLGVVALQLGRVALADRSALAVAVGVAGALTNVGLAFVGGLLAWHALRRLDLVAPAERAG